MLRSVFSRASRLRLGLALIFMAAVSVFQAQRAEANWNGWESLGGITLEEESCVSWGANRIDCFARGGDAAMYHRWWNGSSWGGWENLGGVILESPECVSWGPNRIDCFARGTDQAMYHRWWNGSSWGGWENLGGVILDKPDCVSWGPNRIDCFARGTDAAMWHRWWNGSSWGGWESLGGAILESPECVSWGPNRIDCFARGTDAAMYHRWWNGSSWGGWENLGGTILEQPDCVSWGANRIDCFARGTDRAMWHRWWNGSAWGGWENLGGVILEQPDCTSWAPNRIDCFARGTDRAMWHRWWNGSAWGGWENLGGVILDRPECTSWAANRIDCFARGTDRAMYHRWWAQPGRTRPLTVSRHNTLTFNNADADSILADATQVLRINDGTGDVACDVALTRNGNVQVFNQTDGNLNTANEIQTVFGLAGNVKVVPTVDFCGSLGFNTSIIGCGQTPGPSFITERFTASQEGILWAHEFGHNTGLPHRNDTSDAVMFPSIGSNRLRVNATECGSFRGASPATAAMAQAEMPAGSIEPQIFLAQAQAEKVPQQLPPVEEFVRQIRYEGLPLDVAARYGDADMEKLVAMLQDPAELEYHENIANVIGMIGNPDAVPVLIEYAENGPSTEGRPDGIDAERAAALSQKGRVAAVVALGYIANRSGNQDAVTYLIDSTGPDVWRRREFVATSGADNLARTLSEYSVLALGLSAQPEAISHLQKLQTGRDLNPRITEFRNTIRPDIDAALSLSREIAPAGIVEYYSRR